MGPIKYQDVRKTVDAVEQIDPLGKDKQLANVVFDLLVVFANLFQSLLQLDIRFAGKQHGGFDSAPHHSDRSESQGKLMILVVIHWIFRLRCLNLKTDHLRRQL
jgi:hypothetical protein